MLQFDTIFLVGPQGSGKSTQGKRLASRLGFFYFEMGKVLRDFAQGESPQAAAISGLISKGALISDEILLSVAQNALRNLPKDQGVIFDGIPRRKAQAAFLIDWLKSFGKKEFMTLQLQLPRDISVQRLLLRAQIEGRADDTPAAIQFRLDQFMQEADELVAYLADHTTLLKIDAAPAIDEVNASIDARMQDYEKR